MVYRSQALADVIDQEPAERTLPEAPHFNHERALLARGLRFIAGVDEVGRGPLCGPVVAAAVILDPQLLPEGVTDSKQLDADERQNAFDQVMQRAVAVGIGMASAAEIDTINIRQATHTAMRRALAALSVAPAFALIDGNDCPKNLRCEASTLIKGDAISLSIAAASVIAKVTRDRLMHRMGEWHPQYGFADHVGYPTKRHREAIAAHGPCAFHRLSFGSLKG
ncbi:ribonuclease HII [Methylocella sp. CPCC 101449]|jgi:ribonuclease HII|uniref:ribonuclease HII n=1 Tax=Methylocella sp. CPCC 101449 TaxID=2987531 RepID=UPI002890A86D|nr:ribonuclease HII [Methylocella sp. CPCC 101449]MDT2020141.1 ribonuclease HII [Methylocella sp. CPCC 101449]HEV2574919.1 ribonuclease HII [Beijerinckiaceae bacterium]